MKKHSLIRILPVVLLLLATGMLVTRIYFPDAPLSDDKTCSVMAAKDPARAMKEADAWRKRDGNSVASQHCEAMALYGLKNYKGAASLLSKLAEENAQTNPTLALDLLSQAVVASRSDGGNSSAIEMLSDLLALPQGTLPDSVRAGALTEQAKLYQSNNDSLQAIQDVDQALALKPNDEKATALLADLYSKTSPAR